MSLSESDLAATPAEQAITMASAFGTLEGILLGLRADGFPRTAKSLEDVTPVFRDLLSAHNDLLEAVRRLRIENERMRVALEFISDRENLMFTECTDAARIIAAARAGLGEGK